MTLPPIAMDVDPAAMGAEIDRAKNVRQRPKKAMPISPGRPKGLQNKNTVLLKEALLRAADAAGGREGMVGYLTTQAKQNPGPFMALLGKVLPLQVAGDPANPLRLIVTGVPRADDTP